MSDNVNSAIVQPIGIDVLGQYQKWAQLQQTQQNNALLQQQTQGAGIQNELQNLNLQKSTALAAPYLAAAAAAPSGAPASYLGGLAQPGASKPPPASAPNMLAGLGAGAGGSSSSGGGTASTPPASGATATSAASYLTQPPVADPSGWGKPLPAGTDPTAATHSPGMPAPGDMIGSQVSPSAIQTLYGAPVPFGWGQAVAFAPPGQQGAVMKDAMEARRTRLQELYNYPNWSQGIQQAAQEGWMDPQLATVVVNHPELRDKLLQTVVSPDAYFAGLEKYSGQGLRPDPTTGQLVVSPVSIQAAGLKAQSTAAGTSAGELPNAQALAYDRARGAAGAATQPLTVQATDADGRPQFQTDQQGRQVLGPDGRPIPILVQKIVNNGVLADQSGGGGQSGGAPSGGALTGLGAPGSYPPGAQPAPARSALSTPQMFPGSDLPPSDPRSATAAGSLLGGIPAAHYDRNAAPVPMNPSALAAAAGGAATPPGGWGKSAPNVPAAPTRSMLPPVAAPAATQPGGALAGLSAPQPAVRAPAAPQPAAYPVVPAVAQPSASSAASVPGLDTGVPAYTPPQTAALKVATDKTIAQNASDISAMQEYRTEAAKSSSSAQTQNAILDQMRGEATGFDHGSFANTIQSIKKDVGSLTQAFGSAMPDSVASWENFQKNSGTLARSAASSLSPRVGVQELELVQKYLPSATMSSQGFNRIADQLQGLNDYQVARTQAAANFQGNPGQFEAQFARSVTPAAFIVNRMPAADLQTFVSGLNQSAEGRATLATIRSGIAFARQNGLMQAPGGGVGPASNAPSAGGQ